jgi:hypothetical protein
LRVIEFQKLLQSRSHNTKDAVQAESFSLDLPGSLGPAADSRGRFTIYRVREVAMEDARDFKMQVEMVEQ